MTFAGSHTSDARAAYIFPPFDDVSNSLFNHGRVLKIELAKHCYFCFQDRFYLVPEIAVLIRATQVASELRRIEPFTILRHDGIEYQPVTGTVPEIMAELVRMLREQADNALTNSGALQDASSCRSRHLRPAVRGASIAGINGSYTNARASWRYTILPSTAGRVGSTGTWKERLVQEGATPAGQMRVPPPPPTPSGRTGPVPPQPSSAPAARPPPAPPSRSRSPGGAASSSTDVPKRSATPPVKAAPAVKAKDKGNSRSCKEHIASATSEADRSKECTNRPYLPPHLLLLRRLTPLVAPRSTSRHPTGMITLQEEVRSEALPLAMHLLPLPPRQNQESPVLLRQPPEGVLGQDPPVATTMGVDAPFRKLPMTA